MTSIAVKIFTPPLPPTPIDGQGWGDTHIMRTPGGEQPYPLPLSTEQDYVGHRVIYRWAMYNIPHRCFVVE